MSEPVALTMHLHAETDYALLLSDDGEERRAQWAPRSAVRVLSRKRRIVEVYLNVAEFDEGVFGVEAAARHYFGVGPEALTAVQAARLAAVLPNPKGRSASKPTASLRKRSRQILDGAATIRADGRAACFES